MATKKTPAAAPEPEPQTEKPQVTEPTQAAEEKHEAPRFPAAAFVERAADFDTTPDVVAAALLAENLAYATKAEARTTIARFKNRRID